MVLFCQSLFNPTFTAIAKRILMRISGEQTPSLDRVAPRCLTLVTSSNFSCLQEYSLVAVQLRTALLEFLFIAKPPQLTKKQQKHKILEQCIVLWSVALTSFRLFLKIETSNCIFENSSPSLSFNCCEKRQSQVSAVA